MGWLFVALASACEMVGVLGLRLYSTDRNLRNGFIYFGGIAVSFAFIYMSFSYLLVSVAYSVYVGFGTAGAVIMNMLFFSESKSMFRIVSLVMIIAGVTGLKALS
ncbi:DMT family transporter [Virgibacillus sp. W0430]|uniref:DMT family transporter n=1 Tax=Virgibacillus sp. W0430 TaxID=3391580 RepID=UPI003F487F5F